MVIRKIGEFAPCDRKVNRPEDLAFHAQLNKLVKQPVEIQSKYQMEEWILTQKSGVPVDAEVKLSDQD